VDQQQQPQIYDATLKSFFGDEVAEILPALIPGAEFISECNIELDRTIIKPDLVFRGRYQGELAIINNDKRFSDHLVRFQTIMWRSKTMGEPEKREIEEELKMIYKIDQFIDGNPHVEERVAQRRAEERAKGRAEGMQQLILDAIKARFPALADQAQPQIEQMQDTDALETLFRHLLTATTERDARQILQIQEYQ
jgi:hypothetical protein